MASKITADYVKALSFPDLRSTKKRIIWAREIRQLYIEQLKEIFRKSPAIKQETP